MPLLQQRIQAPRSSVSLNLLFFFQKFQIFFLMDSKFYNLVLVADGVWGEGCDGKGSMHRYRGLGRGGGEWDEQGEDRDFFLRRYFRLCMLQ